MVGEVEGVRAPADAAEATERDLRSRGLCDWLVTWHPATGEHVYCGAPANDGLCSEHMVYARLMGPEQDPDRT